MSFNVMYSTVYQSITNENWTQIDIIDNIYYYFHDTQYYTILMQITPNNDTIIVSHNNKKIGVITYDTVELNLLPLPSVRTRGIGNGDILNLANSITQLVSSEELILESTLDRINDNEIQARNPIIVGNNPGLTNALSVQGHQARNATFIGSQSGNGVVGRVYESTTFSHVNVIQRFLDGGWTQLQVGTALSKPVSIVAGLFRFVGGVLASSVWADIHTISVRYVREGRVNRFTMLSLGRVLQYRVVSSGGHGPSKCITKLG